MDCIICKEKARKPRKIGGWVFCEEHKVVITPSDYRCYCRECCAVIELGEEAVIALDEEAEGNKWRVMHPRTLCRYYEPHVWTEDENVWNRCRR